MIEDRRPLLVITARAGSTRLPRKVLRPIYKSYTILEFLIQRLRTNHETSRLILSTGDSVENDVIEDIGRAIGIPVLRGPEDDVMERVHMCLKSADDVKFIGRVTADNPLTDPELILIQLKEMIIERSDYSYCLDCPTGTAVDLWTSECFMRMYGSVKTDREREHINAWVWENPEINNILWFKPPRDFRCKELSVTIDTENDYEYVRGLINKIEDPICTGMPKIIDFYGRSDECFGHRRAL